MIVALSSPIGIPEDTRLSIIFNPSPTQSREVHWLDQDWQEYVVDEDCTFLTSGVSPECHIWLCGGGAGGGGGFFSSTTTNSSGGGGGGGGYFVSYTSLINSGSITIGQGGEGGEGERDRESQAVYGGAGGETILAMNGIETFTARGGEGNVRDTVGGNGGSGGGAGWWNSSTNYAGQGCGLSTIPFNDSANWRMLCAGGGAGSPMRDSSKQYRSGAGGSNGANGGARGSSSSTWGGTAPGGAGGVTGGGKGGNAAWTSPEAGSPGTDYGAGGGGGSVSTRSASGAKPGGAGYKGCCIIRIPLHVLRV